MLGHILESCRYVYLFVLFGFWLFALLLVREKKPYMQTREKSFQSVQKLYNSQDLISNSPYCLPNDSRYVSLENLVSDQLVTP